MLGVGVSSFGFSGTIAHAALYHATAVDHSFKANPLQRLPSWTRHKFAWVSGDVACSQTRPGISSSEMDSAFFEIILTHPGSISNLVYRPQLLSHSTLRSGNALIDVQATALNFRDVLNALGLDPTGLVQPLGNEAAGCVFACDSIPQGAYAYGLVPGSLRSRVFCDARYIAEMPDAISFEEAVTLPVVWVTAHYCLGEAKLRSMRSMLLHAASGGVGLVSVDSAHRLHAITYATAGATAKHRLLNSHGVFLLASSRNAAACATRLTRLLRGHRVHAVINALSKDFIAFSFVLLAQNADFLEIGKNGIWSDTRSANAQAEVNYIAVAVDDGCLNCPGWNHDPMWFHGQLQKLTLRVQAQQVVPLPLKGFAFEEQAVQEAFRLLQRGGNLGKVVIRVSDAVGATFNQIVFSGYESAMSALIKLKRIPGDLTLVCQLHRARIASDGALQELCALLQARSAPTVAVCFGHVSGASISIVRASTYVVAHQDATFDLTVTGSVLPMTLRMKYHASFTQEGILNATDALRVGFVDAVEVHTELAASLHDLVSLFSKVPSGAMTICMKELPPASIEMAIVASGALNLKVRDRGNDLGALIRLALDADTRIALLEINDPKRFNTLGWELGDDMFRAVEYLAARVDKILGVSLQGAGTVFCAGGNPYSSSGQDSLAASARHLLNSVRGFAGMRDLGVPVVCAVHGQMVGGAAAVFLHSDLRVAEAQSTFQHGNLSRGVCPVAGYSRTLPAVIGSSRASRFYLTDQVLTASHALALGLVHVLHEGVDEAKSVAQKLLREIVPRKQVALAAVMERCVVDLQRLAAEAVFHVDCLVTNGGLQTSNIASSSRQCVALEWKAFDVAKFKLDAGKSSVLFCRSIVREATAAVAAHETYLTASVHMQLGRRIQPCITLCCADAPAGALGNCHATAVLVHIDTRFSFDELASGIFSGVVSKLVHRRLSGETCRRLLTTGAPLDAAAARRLGLAESVAGTEELEAEGEALVEHVWELWIITSQPMLRSRTCSSQSKRRGGSFVETGVRLTKWSSCRSSRGRHDLSHCLGPFNCGGLAVNVDPKSAFSRDHQWKSHGHLPVPPCSMLSGANETSNQGHSCSRCTGCELELRADE